MQKATGQEAAASRSCRGDEVVAHCHERRLGDEDAERRLPWRRPASRRPPDGRSEGDRSLDVARAASGSPVAVYEKPRGRRMARGPVSDVVHEAKGTQVPCPSPDAPRPTDGPPKCCNSLTSGAAMDATHCELRGDYYAPSERRMRAPAPRIPARASWSAASARVSNSSESTGVAWRSGTATYPAHTASAGGDIPGSGGAVSIAEASRLASLVAPSSAVPGAR